jgi:AcrR family transcriptional regulator
MGFSFSAVGGGHIDSLHTVCQAVYVTQTATTTRDRILGAAFTLFGRYGYRRTSMEDIASEAGLSRAALYLQFHNKEDIFRALATTLHEEALAGAEAALEGDGPLNDRLRAAVEAKTLRMIEIAYTSPHGSELMDERNRLCGDLAVENEERFREMVAAAFESAGEIDLAGAGVTAQDAADLLVRAVAGLKDPQVSTETYRERLRSFVRVFVAGLRSTPTRR